jgi:hypothetical protein
MGKKTAGGFRKLGTGLALSAMLVIQAAVAQPPASAGLPSYDVELVIFRHLGANASPEQWETEVIGSASQLAIPDDEQTPFSSSTPAPAVDTTTTFPALPPAKYKLTAIADTLRRSRNYQPLAHIGWTQPGFPRNAARYYSVAAVVPPASGVTGEVALSRGRFLHLTLDLVYEAPATATEPAQRFVLRQARRMRSNERHYVDHPKFGVIAVITPSTE